MAKLVKLIIEGIQVEAPEGTLVVNAAKRAGVDIPVFCYHPKMEPVGMCRMCLVEVGRPVIDRVTGQVVQEGEGKTKIQFSGKLETACTTPVAEGMVILGTTDKVKTGRKDILEFLLTSHPLDCPICDKGGECSLQNLTLGFGPGQSRYLYDEKKHLAKHVRLGDLIVLDRERCIQCARCVRFQSEVAGDPVIGFFNRGRSLEITTQSEPGFDSYFSGNTTDICPVGALTTVDFRFRARPWELRAAASLCNHCPVGCNITLNVRREAASGGGWVVKRVLPRQNEMVNEIWVCDKGRFGHHFAGNHAGRLEQPLVRKSGELQPVSWDEALSLVAERWEALQTNQAGKGLLTLAGGRLANEDLFNLQQLTHKLGGKGVIYTHMGGGELTTQMGFAPGTNFAEMGKGSAILVVACDLSEEAPIWWLRVKQAARRGAQLIVLNPRPTRLDKFANHAIHYPFGSGAASVLMFGNALSLKRPELPQAVQALGRSSNLEVAAKAFAEAQDAVILYGSEGMGLTESGALAQACANLLIVTGHLGRPNNGLLGVWPRANDQGAFELGWLPSPDLRSDLQGAGALYIVAADPVGDDPVFQAVFGGEKFVVVQDIFMTQTARLADVVFPAQSWIEREGSYTSGERRVQRFYPALQPVVPSPPMVESPNVHHAMLRTTHFQHQGGPQADFVIAALVAERIGIHDLVAESASAVFARLAKQAPVFNGLTYQKLAVAHEQWPIIGRGDLHYGGTSYENSQGLGVQLPFAQSGNAPLQLSWPQTMDFKLPKLGMMAFPITRLYDRGQTLLQSSLLAQRIGEPYIILNIQDGSRLKIQTGSMVRVTFMGSTGEAGMSVIVQACLDENLPERVVLAPRSFGIPISNPTPVEIKVAV
jgi:NADH-quinone oxidoreductase subunit G